jgi:predicted dehydrogenase
MRLKIGVIGCGAIAQVQHLPHLRELSDDFEIAGLCDLSPKLLASIGDEYGVPAERRFLDYHDLLRGDCDAVIVCPFGSHAPASIAAAQAGKHVLVEKPMANTAEEATAIASAAEAAGIVLMSAYMKRYDPAYQFAQSEVRAMRDVRFVQVNHLHPDNSLHLAEFHVRRFDDLPQELRVAARQEARTSAAQALGFASPEQAPAVALDAYQTVLGSMIHDIGNLHGLFGPPARVVSTELWAGGRGITTTLAYVENVRAVCTWVDLPELWDFRETLEVYGSTGRVLVSFPSGFSRGLPTDVTVQGMDADRTPWRKAYSWHDNPFKRELQHFRDCVLAAKQPETLGADAVHDIVLVRDIILAYLRR